MRGAPDWHRQHSVQHPSSVSALRADPPPGASHGPRPPFGPHRGRRKKGRYFSTLLSTPNRYVLAGSGVA
ncbi:MAG: hypothetical protein EOR08_05885 [Mesorhizobium sp.]|nr:MAG: hypothetical protein EOR04_20080 [Mesorhizobium sp.]RWP65295.1 MAG: hypothetical protein EOR08_05885 [Mesorhizobium sp.]